MTDKTTQTDALELETLETDTLDDASRRALLGKLTRVGAVAVPVSAVMLDARKAAAQGTSPEISL